MTGICVCVCMGVRMGVGVEVTYCMYSHVHIYICACVGGCLCTNVCVLAMLPFYCVRPTSLHNLLCILISLRSY